MKFQSTTAVTKIAKLRKRLKIIQGGSSAGKTIAILLILIDIAQSRNGLLISVVSETLPHLKRGAMRDFLNIMKAHGYYNEDDWSRTEFMYTFETGSRIEFFSADSPDKVRGPRRDILFLNEANNINYEAFTQLSIRTNEDIYIDYNPVAEFWVHDKVKNEMDNDFIILTYKDNEALPQTIVDDLESRKGDKSFWDVYGLGQLGEAKGRIYTGWRLIDEIPHEARLVSRGLDFGFSNDPSALVSIYKYDGGFIIHEELFQLGMRNAQIAEVIKNLPEPQTIVLADSAEPKSITEIAMHGINIKGASKGKGSVIQGIDYIKSQKISVTKSSLNVIKAYRNYLWDTDRYGKEINKPSHMWSDCMDAVRYGLNAFMRDSTTSADYRKEALKYAEYNSGGIKYHEGLGVKADEFKEYERQARRAMLK